MGRPLGEAAVEARQTGGQPAQQAARVVGGRVRGGAGARPGLGRFGFRFGRPVGGFGPDDVGVRVGERPAPEFFEVLGADRLDDRPRARFSRPVGAAGAGGVGGVGWRCVAVGHPASGSG